MSVTPEISYEPQAEYSRWLIADLLDVWLTGIGLLPFHARRAGHLAVTLR